MKPLQLMIFVLTIRVVSFAQTKDETVIRTTIESQIRNFHSNPDRKASFGDWQLQPETRWVSSNLDGSVLFFRGEDFKRIISDNSFPPGDSATFTLSNFVIKADGKVGWATFDDKTVFPDGKAVYLHQFRLLEKVGATWKIISGGAHEYKPQ